MPGINFIGPGTASLAGKAAEEIASLPAYPKPYSKESLLTDHLINACFLATLDLTARQHVNPATGEDFRCISYYSEYQRDLAISSQEEIGYVTTMSAPFVRRLVKIAHLLTPALDLRPRASAKPKPEQARPKLPRDAELNKLLEGKAEVSEAEALGIVSGWPEIKWGNQIELGSYTLFYDMIRLIWLHEWAHCLCGHTALAKSSLGLERLHESAAKPAGAGEAEAPPPPEVKQSFELFADRFAVDYCVRDILWGNDPIANLAGPRIDLLDRLLLFNVACSIFTIVWTLSEMKNPRRKSFWPRPGVAASGDAPAPLFSVTESTHPPAALRYEHFRFYQRRLTNAYGNRAGRPEAGMLVDGNALLFLKTLGELSAYFLSLDVLIPVIGKTPTTKVLQAYASYLEDVGVALTPALKEFYYLPSQMPVFDENESPATGESPG